MITVTLDDFRYGTQLTVDIQYKAHPGEPMVMYYPDGSGYPGSPPEAELLSVCVTRWEVEGDDRRRGWHWVWFDLDRIATAIIESDWERYEELCFEDANEREEY